MFYIDVHGAVVGCGGCEYIGVLLIHSNVLGTNDSRAQLAVHRFGNEVGVVLGEYLVVEGIACRRDRL